MHLIIKNEKMKPLDTTTTLNNEDKFNNIKQEIDIFLSNKEISDIVELTYSYVEYPDDWTNWNTSLFNRLIRNNYDIPDKDKLDSDELMIFFHEYKPEQDYKITRMEILSDIWWMIEKSLKDKLSKIDEYISSLNKVSNLNDNDDIIKELFLDSLVYTRNMLEITLIWLPFELDKAWLPHWLNKELIRERDDKIDHLEEINFWGKICDNPEEVGTVYAFMKSNYEDNKKNLNKTEQKEYELYLKEIEQYLPDEYVYSKKPKKEKHPVFNLVLPREKYIRFFEVMPEISNIPIKVILSEQYQNMYDSDWKLYVPLNSKYKEKPLYYVNPVSIHETVHATTYEQWKKNFNWIKWSWYLQREEWLAVSLENILKDIDLQVWLWDPRILVWELFDWKDTEKFINLHNKLNPDTASWSILRNKRNRDKDWIGAQHKDTSYWRGIREIRQILMIKSETKKKLLIWKMNLPFVKKYWDSFNIPDEVIYPFILWELVNYFAINYYDNPNFKINHELFLKYMNEKYDYINMDEFIWLQEKVFKDRTIVRQVNEIKKMVKELIDNNR